MKKFLFFLCLSQPLFAQDPSRLPRSLPEREGVSSEKIMQFLDTISKSPHELHSLMIVRHGKVVTEGWRHPYRPELKQTMYSVSKSFTATAVGFAVAEKKLSVEDKVISFFPEAVPDTLPPYLDQLRVKDLLTMSVGHSTDPTWSIPAEENWVKAFFKVPIVNPPGSKFLYNSMSTYMLSAIVQKATGQKLLDYLKPRLFTPLSIHDIDWEVCPQGKNVGGWGLRIPTEAMAKFGQLFLQKGKWQGQQILPVSWVEEATTLKILQNPDASPAQQAASDWLQGYCYQMWRSRHDSYRCDGAYGQFIIVLPEQDAVIAITSETADMQAAFNLVWEYLLPAFQANQLPDNPKMTHALNTRLALLVCPLAEGATFSPLASHLSGKTFQFASSSGFKSVRFDFKQDGCELFLTPDSIRLSFGARAWALDKTHKLGPYLIAGAKYNRVGLAPFQTAGHYIWKTDSLLELTLRYTESPHTEKFICRFNDNEVYMDIQTWFNKATERKILKGSHN